MKRSSVFGILAFVLAACGGGNGVDPPVAPAVAPPPLTPQGLIDLSAAQATFEVTDAGVGGDGSGDGGVGGAAGDGAPLAGADVILTDGQGKTVTGKTDAKGGYLLRFKTADFKTPFVLKVVDAGGNVLASANEITIPTGKAARVNINPLTDKVLSDVLPASANGTDKAIDGASVNAAGLVQAKANLLTSIKSALVVANVADSTGFDPVRSAYKYDGTGVDAIIESISHVRVPGTGATQLQAKLAPLVTNADGTVVPTVISAETPLATTQVAIASNPALTFTKMNGWIDYINGCLKGPLDSCNDAEVQKVAISPAYRHNSRDFDEDFRMLLSEAQGDGVRGSEIRNPNILFVTRSAGSTVDNITVVEVTVSQPHTGPLAGNIATPVEYTKVLVFRRDDTTAGLKAGNWILYGNQHAYDWVVWPRYATSLQQNGASTFGSRTIASVLLNFSNAVYNPATGNYVPSGVYAVRLTGPGLPASGVVWAPGSVPTSLNYLTILNKTGEIPTPGTKSTRSPRDFRVGAASHATGGLITDASFSGVNVTDTAVDFSKLQAYSRYTAEIYVQGFAAPFVETTSILAPLASPVTMVNRPIHDLSPSLSAVVPPQAASSSIVVRWNRRPDAVRIDGAYAFTATNNVQNTNVTTAAPDALSLTPTSTSLTVSSPGITFPEMTGAVGDNRGVGLYGRAARTEYTQEIFWSR